MRKSTVGGDRVDALIVTAVKEEYDAVLAVHTEALVGSAWETRREPSGLDVAYRTFVAEGGGHLRVAVLQSLGMGGVEVVSVAADFARAHEVRCLAMCGVCAGRRGKVELGDVIIADRMWTYDTGKRTVTKTAKGGRVEHDQGDTEMYRIRPPSWKQAAERFVVDREAKWLTGRPRSYEAQGNWLLVQLAAGKDPSKIRSRSVKCADYSAVIDQLREKKKKKWLKKGAVALTIAGRKYIEDLRQQYPDGLPKPKGFRTHVGPIATGSKVVEDPDIFDRLAEDMRKVLGLEMEAAAIAGLGHIQQIPYMVVMKAVMDHADAFKSDNFKAFAATASAECLIAFLRANLPVGHDPLDGLLDPGTAPLPAAAGPAALLNARHTVVDFFGREDALADLRAFCESDKPVSARLLYGSGGMGKTRLLTELCKQLNEEKIWRAGFVPKDLLPEQLAALATADRPTLAVIDYAESRPRLKELLEAAQSHRPGSPGKLRLVLLSRNAGDWLTVLRGASSYANDLLSDHAPVELASLAKAGEQRTETFQKAVEGFARALGKGIPKTTAPSLAEPQYARVLYVHMAALAAVERRSVNAATLLDDTLDHEQRFWRTRFPDGDSFDVQLLTEKICRAISAFTLVGGAANRSAARKIIAQATEAPDDKLTLFLHSLYPGGQRAAGDMIYVSGLEPDLLGEAMVLRTLKREGPEAGSYLDRVFDNADQRAARTGFEVLGRLSGEHPEAGEWIARVLDRDVAGRALSAFHAALAIVEDDSIGERAAHSLLGIYLAKALAREGTIAIARDMEDPRLPEQTVSLGEVEVWRIKTLLQHLPEAAENERAYLYLKLGIRQGNLGQREEALTSTQEAIAHYRRLAAARPDAFMQALAGSLSNLGIRQSALGQREEALASVQEAVDVRRNLVAAQPDTFLPDLADGLNNLGGMQRYLGQREAALASAQEAVEHYRKLAATRSDAFLPSLAAGLTNLGAMQSELGQREAALASAQEAVEHYRKLAATRPDAFLPDLANSLNTLGGARHGLGQRDGALASTQEAVEHYRKLAAARPDAFLPDLTVSLGNLGMMQSELGQLETALASTQEALDAIWLLFIALPSAFGRTTGTILGNLLERLEALNRAPPPDLLDRIATFQSKFSP